MPRPIVMLRCAAICLALLTGAVQAQEPLVSAALAEESQTARSSIRAQAQIDQLADQTADVLGEYRVTLQSLDRVKIYNEHLQKVVDDQERSKLTMGQRLENYQRTKQEIVPIMVRLIDSLGRFIELDLPFHLDERRDRVERLRELLDRSDVAISEKYRQLMEAYQIELNFGRDIDAFNGRQERGDEWREVDYLRIGRLVLAYQTLDRSETGFYNPLTRAWEVLPGEQYRSSVSTGLRIARKQAAPDLLRLPVPAPETAQ